MGKGLTPNPTFTISDPTKEHDLVLVFQVSDGDDLNIYDIKYILRGLNLDLKTRSLYTVSYIRLWE